MNVKFSKDELAVVYQYAADTKQETLAGLREIVPVIRDRQTREIVESTIRKLDAIPEPECRRFIADTRQRFIQKRDNSIRRRLAEAKAQTREKTFRIIFTLIFWIRIPMTAVLGRILELKSVPISRISTTHFMI